MYLIILFFQRTTRGCIILTVYVFMAVIYGIQETGKWLHSKLHIKDLGQMQYFLGIKITKDLKGIF